MRYLFAFIFKICFFLIWVVVMIGFGIISLFSSLWHFKDIHWKNLWYWYMGKPTFFPEESETPKALLKTFLNYVRYKEKLDYL